MQIELATAAVHLGTALKYRRDWNKNNPAVQIIEGFNKGKGKKASQRYRLYVPIKSAPHHAKIPNDIAHAVNAAGYEISDYVAGLATQRDGKRVMKIGKLLKDEGMRNRFANDKTRQAHKDEYTCVISCHPYDIIGMSTGRLWDQMSCMRLGAGKLTGKSNDGTDGDYADALVHDIAKGTLVAYAVKNSDPDIKNPDGRVLLKPFQNAETKEIVYRSASKIYGNTSPGFRETISKFLRQVNGNVAAGRYSLMRGLYADGDGYELHHIGPTAYKDLSVTENLEEWTKVAHEADYKEFFTTQSYANIHKLLDMGHDLLYRPHHFNVYVAYIMNPTPALKLPELLHRMEIMIKHALRKEAAMSIEIINSIMNNFFVTYTAQALNDTVTDLLKPLCEFSLGVAYAFPHRLWASKINPMFSINPDGAEDDLLNKGVKTLNIYPLITPDALKARSYTRVRAVATAHSFVQIAIDSLAGVKSEWKQIAPEDVGNRDDFVHAVQERMRYLMWDEDKEIRAFTANSPLWLADKFFKEFSYIDPEQLTLDSLLRTAYVLEIFMDGVPDTEEHKQVANRFTRFLETAISNATKHDVEKHESTLIDCSELLGEHSPNNKRYLVTAIQEKTR